MEFFYYSALAFAAEAHEGQTYGKYSGLLEPYICHPIRVAGRVDGAAKIVALLHDVVEDTEIDIDGLPRYLYPYEVEAIKLLTRDPEEQSYEEYIETLDEAEGEAGIIARTVKMADLRENLAHNPPDFLRERYYKALGKLMYKSNDD